MDENCTADWESLDFHRCACPRCSEMFKEARAAGLMPPVGVDEDGWWAERELRREHAEAVAPRARRRRDREKRRSSRLDGRWHRRVKAQQEREAHFGRLPVRETHPVPEDWMD
jgi:hypothetical protein